MKGLDKLQALLLSPIVGYLIVIVIMFVGVQTSQLVNDIYYAKERIKDAAHQETNTNPVDVFFKDTPYDWERVNIIDRSLSLDLPGSLDALNYDLRKQAINSNHRLIVYIGDTNDISFEQETGDIVRLADTTETSLLAINYGTGATSFTISPKAGAYFTDQEAKQFLDDTVNPALRDNKLEFAIKSTIEKFQLEITDTNFYTASDLRLAQLATATRGTAKTDYVVDLRYYTQELNRLENQLIMCIVGLIILLSLGIYRMWRTHDTVYGFLFGMSVGLSGYIVSMALMKRGAYFSYDQSTVPAAFFAFIGGLVGLFADYILSVPKQKRVRAELSPSEPKKQTRRKKQQ